MKKIINITLGGRNIAIEDSAYEKLKTYTDSLWQYYKNEDGRDEIIADIEGRFSELMNDKLRKGATHISDVDVDEMIAAMGRPEDFDKEAATEENASSNTEGAGFSQNERRRLYRDESNKVLGGVCSGIANWLNIDPTVVRILFAVIAFGGFGSGILVYILLWIFLPTKNLSAYIGKRMFRNPDDKVIGGVAGGMGAYFNINPSTIRWILAIPLILSVLKGMHFFGWNDDFNIFPSLFFGGVTGTFIFVYIVLWIVLPEANSPYEKMEMYGKTVDVNSIKENVQGSMNDMKGRIQNWSEEVKDSAQNISKKAQYFAETRGKALGKEFGYAAQRGGRGIGYAIAMIFKVFFVFVAGTIAISLFVVFLAVLFSGFPWAPVNNFLWTNDQQQMWAWGTILFFIGAPVVGLLVWLVRTIFNIRTPGNYLSWLFSGLWIVGWVCLTMFVSSFSRDIKRVESTEFSINIVQPANGKLILKVSQPALEFKGDNMGIVSFNSDFKGFSLTADTLKLSTIGMDFEKSDDSLYHVIIFKESMGKTDEEALARAGQIQYAVSSADSVLDLPNGFAISKNNKYRFQNVSIKVQVPAGKRVKLDPSVLQKLSDGQIIAHNYRNSRREGLISFERPFSRLRTNVDYIMNDNGKLVAADESSDASDTDDANYRWDNKSSVIVPPPPPAAVLPETLKDTAGVYRYDEAAQNQPTAISEKEKLKKEVEQKQKEIEELKKKLEN
jgi:phage shock protein PspC (stress-responsive transcriptional regulator)